MADAYPNASPIHLPVHASWLNQIEIYFCIMQRKALTPNDFAILPEFAQHLMDFGQHYRTVDEPFEWTFTKAKFNIMINKVTRQEPESLALAAGAASLTDMSISTRQLASVRCPPVSNCASQSDRCGCRRTRRPASPITSNTPASTSKIAQSQRPLTSASSSD